MCENGVYSFHRLRGTNSFHRCGKRTPSTVCGRSPSLEEGGLGGGESGVGRMSAEIATVRCVCNAGLHHCNGWKHLQPSVASPNHVGARIARPFIPDVITTLREGARRVIGATAKPLYPIDGKAGGHDRRNHRPPSLREGNVGESSSADDGRAPLGLGD